MSVSFLNTTNIPLVDDGSFLGVAWNFDVEKAKRRIENQGYTGVAVSRILPSHISVKVLGIPNDYANLPDYVKKATIDHDITLVILTNESTTTSTTISTTTTPTTGDNWFSGYTYTVKAGDTLGKIAARFNTTVTVLARLNNITNVNRINIGQVLRISGNAPSNTNSPLPVNTTNLPVITQPNQTPAPNPFIPPNPKLNEKDWLSSFYDNSKLTAVGIAAIILIGGLVLTSKK